MDAADQLDILARALAAAGRSSRPRYENLPAILHVIQPQGPRIAESVRAMPDSGGRWWFFDSLGDLLGPCEDLPRVIEAIEERLDLCARLTAEWAVPPQRPGLVRRLLGLSARNDRGTSEIT